MRGGAAFASAVYEGVVRHRRLTPHVHSFDYRMAQIYLDLDEVDTVFTRRWLWSARHRNLAQFRRSDYLGPPELTLSDAVRRCVETATGHRPAGPVRMLTHLRYFGFVFNPVTFYYCFAPDGVTMHSIVAEITNTPWKERHCYVLPVAAAEKAGGALDWNFPKAFHVSPFMAMAREYRWSFTLPGDELHVHMDVLQRGEREFDVNLALRRRPLSGAALARILWRYPLMTAQVVGAIHWQALRLWLKRTPIYDHPASHRNRERPRP